MCQNKKNYENDRKDFARLRVGVRPLLWVKFPGVNNKQKAETVEKSFLIFDLLKNRFVSLQFYPIYVQNRHVG